MTLGPGPTHSVPRCQPIGSELERHHRCSHAGPMSLQHFRAPVLAVTLGAAIVSGACSGPTGPSDNASFGDRIGGRWILSSQQPQGQAEMAAPAGSAFGFEIVDSRVAVTADCNRCNGPTVVGDNSITLGPALACTRAFCSTAPFDDTFVRLLAGESNATMNDQTLVLRSDRGVLRFRR